MGSNNELKNTLTGQLLEQFANEDDLEERICENLKGIDDDL